MSNQNNYPMNVLLGFVIRRYREAQHLTQEEVADRAGCHASYLSTIENGRSDLSIRIFDSLCKALAVSAHLLYAQAEALEIQYSLSFHNFKSPAVPIDPLVAHGWYGQTYH